MLIAGLWTEVILHAQSKYVHDLGTLQVNLHQVYLIFNKPEFKCYIAKTP